MTNLPPPPGWYSDHAVPNTECYWDGSQWTGHRRPVTPRPVTLPPIGDGSSPGVPTASRPENYLVWTILATILGCLPVGAVGIYCSTRVDALWLQGDLAGARRQARLARDLAFASALITAATLVFAVVFGIVMALRATPGP